MSGCPLTTRDASQLCTFLPLPRRSARGPPRPRSEPGGALRCGHGSPRGQPGPRARVAALNGKGSRGNCRRGPGKGVRVAGQRASRADQAQSCLPCLHRGLEGARPRSMGCTFLCKGSFAAASAELLMDQHPLSHRYCFI